MARGVPSIRADRGASLASKAKALNGMKVPARSMHDAV